MPVLRPLAIAALLVSGALAPLCAQAQDAAAPGLPVGVRVIRDIYDQVKLPDGSEAVWHIVTTYDPGSGESVRTVTDASGAVIERTVRVGTLMAPNAEEVAAAEALLRADPELSGLIAAADEPVVQGGFILLREEGHPCGPGSRCLQYEVVDVDAATRQVELIRYVVVDLRTGRVVSNDFDIANEGNLANPLHRQ
ncbi:MAG TPA: hypothetical protein VK610_02690 [Rhodothermales bacterium]|nr:hypothetical protein [Rhodothermales bacterium]